MVNQNESLREKVSQKWSELNGVKITPVVIDCIGCCGYSMVASTFSRIWP